MERYCNGEINAAYNCLDIHVENGYGNDIAIIYDSPLTSVIEKISYRDLTDEVIFYNYFYNFFPSNIP